MALDFHRLDNNEYLFGLNDQQYQQLANIFTIFSQWTGLSINPYRDTILNYNDQKLLLKIITEYLNTTNLNKDKLKTIKIIEFKGLLNYFYTTAVDLIILGD